LSLIQGFTRLLQLRQLRGKIAEPSPVFLDHCRRSSFYERFVLQFRLNGLLFLRKLSDLRIQSLPLAGLISGSDREKQFAEWSDRYRGASRRVGGRVECHLFGI